MIESHRKNKLEDIATPDRTKGDELISEICNGDQINLIEKFIDSNLACAFSR
jgi:hypothetical protein